MCEHRTRAFLYKNPPTNVADILVQHGINPDQPIIGFLFYGKPAISKALSHYYHSKGFQIVGLSMYNPYADVNLGHLLSPFEWVEAFKYLSFCVTDRFHGTIFCLRNKIPFISIEPYHPGTIQNSKIYSLLDDFNLTECYLDVYRDDFKIDNFLGFSEELRADWEKTFQPKVTDKLGEMKSRSLDFVEKIKSILL